MSDFHILALETSSNLCSVALLSRLDGRLELRAEHHEGRSEHAERILPMAQALLADAQVRRTDLSAIAFGQGPGGFTGLRVACGVAQGLALALAVPVIPIDSMQAVAVQCAVHEAGVHVVLQDARMNEVYAAAYRHDGQGVWQGLHPPALLSLDDVSVWLAYESPGWNVDWGRGFVHGDALASFPALGEALRRLGLQLDAATDTARDRAQAATIARLAAHEWDAGRVLPPEAAAPAYVRNKVAYTTRERVHGLGGNPQADAGAWTLHRMSESDLDEVAAIEQSVQSFPWTRGNFSNSLSAGHHGWVVRRLGGMQGFALVMDTPDMAHLLVIGVRPDDQRKGVGTRLLQACLAHCRATGLAALTLEVRPSNRQAIDFYRKFGFCQVGLRKAYYPTLRNAHEDAWIMTLDLRTP